MAEIISIDPGSTESAYVIWNGDNVIKGNIVENERLLFLLIKWGGGNMEPCPIVIEQIRSYGMAVGATVFDTVFWSGRFYQVWPYDRHLIPRLQVKQHICHDSRAKDSNIIQALVDRFAYNKKNRGKGTKKDPGFFYGFKDDIWQAFALAVTFWDQRARVEK